MVYRLGLSLSNFKDLTSPTGEILTTYVIRVLYNSDEHGKIVYELEKRYSEFKNLYMAVKDHLPLDYKFPNKSIFNNSAQFTKERRMRGFEELLHHVQRIDSIRDILHSFLELDFNITKVHAKFTGQPLQTPATMAGERSSSMISSTQSEQELLSSLETQKIAPNTHINHHSNTNNRFLSVNEPLPTHAQALAAGYASPSLPDELRVRKSLQTVSQYLLNQENIAEKHFKNNNDDNDNNNNNSNSQNKGNSSHTASSIDELIRQNPKPYLFFAAKVSAFTYVIVVLLGIVDISDAGLSQILLTLLALFLLVLLLRIRYERVQRQKLQNNLNNNTNKISSNNNDSKEETKKTQ